MDIAARLVLNCEVTRRVLVAFLRNEIRRAGFSKAVLGLSGGIDSALACYLVAEALGPENVLVLRLPYRTSSPESIEHANLVIADTHVVAKTVDITPMVDAYADQFPDMDRVRKGNVMARSRMIVLYDHSRVWNGLVIGTSDKTELLLGYGTQFGDMASAINPIGDLYKTQVRQMSRALGVPEVIVAKPPSADLWLGQTSEGELGFSYEEADKLLYLLVDLRYTADEAVAAGFGQELVNAVTRRIKTQQFKRMPPVIAKLSRRDIGHDFLYPRDWGT